MKNSEIFTAEEFIAAITQHLPEKHSQMGRYSGWYSSRSRGERTKAGIFMPGDKLVHQQGVEETELDLCDYNRVGTR